MAKEVDDIFGLIPRLEEIRLYWCILPADDSHLAPSAIHAESGIVSKTTQTGRRILELSIH